MSPLRLSLLGPVSIIHNNKSLSHFPRKSALALLIYLTEIGPKHAPTREHLAELLWPWMAPENGRQNLRQTLYELKKLLPVQEDPAPILITRQTLQRNPQARLELDTQTFEQALQTPTLENLQQAIPLYRGDFLADFYLPDSADFEDWVQTRREYYRRRYQETLLTLISLEPANPLYTRRLLESDPFHEEAARKLMHILANNGARTEAIQVYETIRRQLQDELGLKPQAETVSVYEMLLQGKLEGEHLPTVIPTKSQPSSHLPESLTPFIGRRPEVAQVKALIQNPAHRLITLLGPGGTGKTRLSLQAASELGGVFPDGIFFIALAPVQTIDGVPSALAKALDFTFYPGEESPQHQALNFLREKRLLLILDNFEHLLGVSELIAEILTTAGEVKLVVTTRARLNIPGEQLYPVRGMNFPGGTEADQWNDPETQAKPFGAVQLFLDRTRRVQPGFTLTKENLPAVLEICRLVQGMPLGLELAAAWMELLQPAEIAAEIAHSLDFLEIDQASIPDRQRSIRAVFESSWKLLNEAEREAFLRLCVFVGSFSREAAQEVSGASLKTLLGLANKSWLQQTEGGRFQLHELMHQYGEERLKADSTAWKETKNRHADYFADFVSKQSERMKGPDQRTGAAAVYEEFDTNIRTAWDWLTREKRWGVILDRMLTGLFQMTKVRDRNFELLSWLQHARFSLTALPEDHLAFAIIGSVEIDVEEVQGILDADHRDRLAGLWELSREHGLVGAMGLWFVLLAGPVWRRNLDPDAEGLLEEAVDRLREPGKEWELGWGLLGPINVWGLFESLEEEKLQQAEARLLEAEQIFRTLGTPFEKGQVTELLAGQAISQNRPVAEVEAYIQQATDFYRSLGDNHFIPVEGLAYYYFRNGETEKGFALYDELTREYERVGNLGLLGNILYWESIHAVRYSSLDHAVATRQRAIAIWKQFGWDELLPAYFAFNLYELGEAYRVFGETVKALEAFEGARGEFEKAKLENGLGFYQRSLGDMALKEGHYSEALDHYKQYNAHLVRANQRWGIAQSHGKLALTHGYLGNLEAARGEMRVSLGLGHTTKEFELELIALLAEPVCLIKEEKHEAAVELAAFIANHPVSWNETRWQAQEILDWAAQELSEEVVQKAIERGKELQLDKVIKQLLRE